METVGAGSGGGVGDDILGIERVLRNFLTGGERVPSCARGFAGAGVGEVEFPFLKITGGRNECTLIRGRRAFCPCDWEGNGKGGCAEVEAMGATPTDLDLLVLGKAGSSLSPIDAAGADNSRALRRPSIFPSC